MNKNKELTPLQQLRQNKREIKKQFKEDEERIASNWKYLTHNTGSVFFNTIFAGSKRLLESKGGEERIQTPFGSIGSSFSSIASGLASSLPMVWEFVQPMLIGFVVKKIKGLFTSKKKKRKKASDED